MRTQLELFLTAVGFFTRLPVPGWVPFSVERLAHAARYLPAVGWLVGGLGAWAGFTRISGAIIGRTLYERTILPEEALRIAS